MKTQKEKAIELANRVINNPELLKQLNDEIFIKFVISLTNYSKPLAHKVFDLKSDISSQNKILFWEAVGILKGDMANEFNNNYLADEYEDFDSQDGL